MSAQFRIVGTCLVLGIVALLGIVSYGTAVSANDQLLSYTFTITLGFILAIAITTFFTQWRYPMWVAVLIALALFAVGHLLMGVEATNSRTLFTLFAEATFLISIVLASHQTAQRIKTAESDLRLLAEADLKQPLPKLLQSEETIHAEMTRSRHYERPMSVFVLSTDYLQGAEIIEKLGQEISERLTQEYANARLAANIQPQLRRMDQLMINGNGELVILCPELDESGSTVLADHLRQQAADLLGEQFALGRASFPKDGYTFEALMLKAKEQIDHHA